MIWEYIKNGLTIDTQINPEKELKNGDHFQIRKGGSIWIKLYTQGMHDQVTYVQSLNKSKTRCQRMSYKHKYLYDLEQMVIKVEKT